MDFWVSPAAPQKEELKTTKLPALGWLPLLWAHCWSIAHTALCQNQFRCLSGQPIAQLSPPAHFNQAEKMMWGLDWLLMQTHAWPVKPVQLLKAEEENETEAQWSVHVRQGRDPCIACVQCAHWKIMRGDSSVRSRLRYILLRQPVIILFTFSICLCT